jgi:uncharacterized protein YndB with AHSA1/START domain
VFRAWTDPDHLEWFTNPGYTRSHPTTVDLRVGGAWRLHMVEGEEKSYTTGGIYREIVRPDRLSFSWGAVDCWPTIDLERIDDVPFVTITLTDADGTTEMAVLVELAAHLTEDEVRDWFATGIERGWKTTLDRHGALV